MWFSPDLLVPALVCTVLALLLVWAAYKRPKLARALLAVLFGGAAVFNARLALTSPAAYLSFAQLSPVAFYRDFIEGFFAAHTRTLVLLIAAGQACIAMGLAWRGTLFRVACAGGMAFGIGITPLGVGSGFPSPLILAVAFYVLMRKEGVESYSVRKIR
jgi:hypothetical protein